MLKYLPILTILAAPLCHAQQQGAFVKTAGEVSTAAQTANAPGAQSTAPNMLLFSGKPREPAEAPRKRADFSLINAPATPLMTGVNSFRY